MRYDVVTSRKDKDGKWRNTKIGAAFPQEGGRISIVLDALPISIWEGQVRMTLFEAKPKDEAQQAAAPAAEEMNDEIPF
jgi:hypothetical protein